MRNACGPEATADPGAPVPLIELRKLDKRFPGTHALKAVDLSLFAGEVHAIVGENGAGKSTLIKLLTGAYTKSGGEILWEGRPVVFARPNDAISLGINAVHQEVVLCRHLTVAANIFLGGEDSRLGILKNGAMVRAAQRILDGLGFSISASANLGSLTIGQQQLVATARAAARGSRLIIFDEPTAYLTRQETEQLFKLIRRMHADHITVIYISHRLEEIFQLADRVSVLRDGVLVSTRRVAETDEQTLIRDMVSRSIGNLHYKEDIGHGAVIFEAKDLTGQGFENISMTVRSGEIAGLYGLIGAGRSEFVQCVFGRRPKTGGEMRWRGEPLRIRSERDAMRRGIALIPESRRDQGLCLNLGVSHNLNLPIFDRLTRHLLINRQAEMEHADRQIADLRIVTASRALGVNLLSGGNQQKVVVGKWLNHGAELFILDEPTVGVDVGTKVEIYKLMAALLRKGAGIILISSYLPEVYDLSDSLYVFRRGRMVAQHARNSADHETILKEAIGA